MSTYRTNRKIDRKIDKIKKERKKEGSQENAEIKIRYLTDNSIQLLFFLRCHVYPQSGDEIGPFHDVCLMGITK